MRGSRSNAGRDALFPGARGRITAAVKGRTGNRPVPACAHHIVVRSAL